MSRVEDPLASPPPPEVALGDAPLVRVIAQVRFPEILAVEQREFVAPFQEALRSIYPVLRAEQTQNMIVSPAGVTPGKPTTAWRFSDLDDRWRVSLTPGFLALETTQYDRRVDFIERLGVVLGALHAHVRPELVDRLGIRYIDRISGVAVEDIEQLVYPEVRGVAGSPISTRTIQSLSETLFDLGDANLLARWGLLPPGMTIDAAIEPASERSWILDLDMFSSKPVPFSVQRILADSHRYAERIYTFFRWAVTEEFLRRYGGKL